MIDPVHTDPSLRPAGWKNPFTSKEEFVLEYLRDPKTPWVSVLDSDFHDAFYARFGGARTEKLWGAQSVAAAMRALSALHTRGYLRRARTGLRGGEWQPGFPKWVWEYAIDDRWRLRPDRTVAEPR